VPARLREAFARGGVAFYVEYGAREASGIASTYPVDPDPSLETVGPPLPTAELEIVDGEGNAVPRGEIGEIRVRTTAMIHAYHRDPVATSRHFKDGWFHPGDLGSLTANGSLCLHGRADDMMNMNGIKIFPAEIERTLEGDPAVRAAAAFGLPSPMHGQIPVAAVELHDPATHSVAALLARARERLGVRAPRKIFVVDALPRNATGKVLKRELVSLLSQPDVRNE
jgi:acyl-CoA synthetase (AMP-forming)/AMP-acid ligase II